MNSPSGLVGLVGIGILILIALIAPIVLGSKAATLNVFVHDENPSWTHLLGTDGLGRDILARLLVATRLSLGLAVAATALAAAIGLTFGGLTAILGPRPRAIAMRIIDTSLAFPAILVAILVGVMIGPGPLGVVLGIGIALSFSFARVTSTLALSVGGRDYIAAARVIGIGPLRRLYVYIIPNIADTMIVATSVAISAAIVAISSLSFLGLGVQSPDFDWGVMLTQGVQAIYETPAAALAPAAAIALSAIVFGYFGEALARAMNPMIWTSSGKADARSPKPTDNGHGESARISGQARSVDGRLLSVRDLVVSFPGPRGRLEVVSGVSFDVGKGEVFGVVGESGSGKTMTALAIAQLVPYPGKVSGVIELAGRDLRTIPAREVDRTLGKELAVIFQDPMSSLNPALKVGIQLTEGAMVHGHATRQRAEGLALARLSEVGIATPSQQLHRHPQEFSGGMRQRLMIAMGLINEPQLLIADEPTTALDVTVQAQIMALLRQINRDRRASIILISHNLALVAQNCQRIAVMYAGRIVEEGPTEAVVREPLHPY
ncbi:MAG TPA: dipeptide/oligopeptide/nickel ABC transporter permease/ATP-binding protein, partial [Isosphaeraceae bacterium]|nr:dipeptide/oligopeptide/nickel ABC transporter permease/ATP-binding protein [Isosphaeraceae bacterium]